MVQLSGRENIAEIRHTRQHNEQTEQRILGELVASAFADLHQNGVQIDAGCWPELL